MARFFIDRPIFAWVIAIIIMLAGALAITQLPVSQYPTIAPPSVTISATYPGASAKAVEDSVTQIIEQNMKGLDGLHLHVVDQRRPTVSATITLTFDNGTDPDIAQVQVQNKLQLAMPLLPQAVQQQGVSVTKSRSRLPVVIGLRLRGRQHGPGRHLRLRRRQRGRPAQPRRRASATCRCSAPRTRCASGSIRTSSTPTS